MHDNDNSNENYKPNANRGVLSWIFPIVPEGTVKRDFASR